MSKRLAIYVHYDKNGEVRDYVLYCLKGLQEIITDILVVVNGELSVAGRKRLQSLNVDILTRENKGFDFAAWKVGIEYYGYERIAQYDELLLTNNTYYGPIYPFAKMWQKMDMVDCDFWGINKHPKSEGFIIPGDKRSKCWEHLQSYWLVFRKNILVKTDFQKYWTQQKIQNTVAKVIGYCETKLTKYFENKGYKHACYMDYGKYKKLIHSNPCILTDMQVIDDRCPIIRRKYFWDFKKVTDNYVINYHARNLLDFIAKTKLYDVNMIWDDLLAVVPGSILNETLHLNYVLSSDKFFVENKKSNARTALIMYIFHADLIEYCYNYAQSMPSWTDMIIVNTSPKVAKRCKRIFGKLKNKIIYKLQPNRGRDSAALLVTCKNLIKKYDYLCFVHSKKSLHLHSDVIGEEFRNHNFMSLLYNQDFVRNVIHTFDNNSRLGLLVPFTINEPKVLQIIGNEWRGGGNNKYIMAQNVLRKYFNLDILNLDKHVMAPFGGMYWVRTKALKTLTSYNWQYKDFLPEPVPADGSLSHILERLWPVLVQNDGFYTAFLAPDKYARAYMGNLYSSVQKTRIVSSSLKDNKTLFWWARILFSVLVKITFGKLRQYYAMRNQEIKEICKEINTNTWK